MIRGVDPAAHPSSLAAVMLVATSRMEKVISSMALVVSSTLAAMDWTFSATS